VDYALLVLLGILTIVAVATVAPKLGVAAPLVLVVVGIAASFFPGLPPIDFPPELILSLVLPPILYAAAVNVPLLDLRRNIKAITGLSVLLVIVSAVGAGLLLYWLLPNLNLAAAIALGAVISPPDAVAATSIGKRLGLPPRLVTLLEGEGLVNDASALVLLRSAVAAAAGTVSLWGIVGDFAFAVAAAIAVGVAIGYASVWVRAKLGNLVVNTTISFAVPFLAYIPAEELGASGVLAVVVAGLVTGHQSARYFTAQGRISERLNWRTVQFVLENGVFLLMGLELKSLIEQVHDGHLGAVRALGLGLLATVALVVIRIAFVVPLIALLRRDQRRAQSRGKYVDSALKKLDLEQVDDGRNSDLGGEIGPLGSLDRAVARVNGLVGSQASSGAEADADAATDGDTGAGATDGADGATGAGVPDPVQARRARAGRFLRRKRADFDFLTSEGLGWRGGAVLAWAGMRGVVTLAAAQSLPRETPYRPQLVLIAFTVAVVTLLVQGGTLPVLIKALGIVGTDTAADRTELASLVEEISGVGLAALDNPDLVQENGDKFDPAVVKRVRTDSRISAESAAERAGPELAGPHQQHRALRLTVLQAERAALLDARAAGTYSSRVMERAQHMLDLEEARLAQLGDES
jgi:monovalent cation/hydrogen antiporter